MVQARGGVKIKLREIPLYGIVVIDPFALLPVDAGFEPFLLSINGQSLENQSLWQLRTKLLGEPGTPVTLDIVSSDLNFHQFVTLIRTTLDSTPAEDPIWFTLETGFDLLDSVDTSDWPGKYLQQVDQSSNILLEPLSSALFNVSMQLSQSWLDRRSFIHLFTHISAANYFDRVYRIDDADLAFELALQSLPDFDCLDFDESAKLFEFADHLIETERFVQAKILLDKLLDAARDSLQSEDKTLMCLLRMIRLPGVDNVAFLDKIFEISGLLLPPEDLFLLGDCYLRSGDYKNAIKVYACSFAQAKYPVLVTTKLKDFTQPRALSKHKQCVAYEKAGIADGVLEKTKEAMAIFSEYSPKQMTLIDQLPAFFPKPKFLAAKLANLDMPISEGTAGDAEKPFYLHARIVLDTLANETKKFADKAITELLSRAATEEHETACENLVWDGLLNLARQCLKEERFHVAKPLLERISQQSQGADFAPLYLVGCFTEQAIFADQLNLDSEYCWSRLQALLLNFFVANQLWERELRDLQAEIQEKQLTTLRHQTIRAKILRFWSLVYLRSNDCKRAEKILTRALICAESAAAIANTAGLYELISLIHGDLAVAKIELSRLADAEVSIEKMFDCPSSFFTKIYQIAEAYKKSRHFENAENLLARSVKLPERRSVLCRRINFSEGAWHIWKLATVKKEHQQYLEEAVVQFPSNALPPLLGYLAGEYALSQNQFNVAQSHFQRATKFPDWQISDVASTHFRRTMLLKALKAAERGSHISHSQECDLLIALADLSQTTNRLSAVINYRRAIALLPAPSRQRNVLADRLRKLTANKTQAEQFAEEVKFAHATKDCQVRTERYWVEFATEEFRRNRLMSTVECIAHALEIYKLSAKVSSNFQPLFICQQKSLPELLRDKGFVEDAESYMLEAVKITTAKYGVESEQEALCLAELAHFYFNSHDLIKTMSIVHEILRSYSLSLGLAGASQQPKGSALIFRLHQLTLQMATGGRLDKAIELLEAILKEEKRPDYSDVLSKLGKDTAAKKITYLFSKAANEAIAEQNLSKYASSWNPPLSKEKDTDEWENLGRTKQAQGRYIKSVKIVREHYCEQDLAIEALNSLAAYYVENVRLGQAAEIYLQLIERLKTSSPDYSFRKVLCFLSLARCYTRLCMYEEVPDLVLQAKQADPEIYQNIRTLDTTLNYVDLEVEAHLLDSARDDLKTAESLIDEQVGHDLSKRRAYLERILQLWKSLGDPQSAAHVKAQLDEMPLPEVVQKTAEVTEETTQEAPQHDEPKPVFREPLPFAFLECVGHSFNLKSSVLENPAYIYLKDVAERISENWFPPVEKQPTRLQIQFSITTEGRCASLQLLSPSSNKYANIAAEEAIQTSAPFAPLHEEFGELTICQLTFNDANYCLDKSGITFESLE